MRCPDGTSVIDHQHGCPGELQGVPGPPSVDQAPGLFSVRSDPYASITIDNAPAGDTPLYKRQLAPGRHTIVATNSTTHQIITMSITIESGKEENAGTLSWPEP